MCREQIRTIVDICQCNALSREPRVEIQDFGIFIHARRQIHAHLVRHFDLPAGFAHGIYQEHRRAAFVVRPAFRRDFVLYIVVVAFPVLLPYVKPVGIAHDRPNLIQSCFRGADLFNCYSVGRPPLQVNLRVVHEKLAVIGIVPRVVLLCQRQRDCLQARFRCQYLCGLFAATCCRGGGA